MLPRDGEQSAGAQALKGFGEPLASKKVVFLDRPQPAHADRHPFRTYELDEIVIPVPRRIEIQPRVDSDRFDAFACEHVPGQLGKVRRE